MKYNTEKTAERLHGVPLENRVFIYDAAIIIEFLNQTFMPISYFLSPKGYKEIGGTNPFEKENFKDPNTLETYRESIGTIYDWYKMFREQRDYTAPIESRHKFQIILKKMNFNKNNWCFDVKRVTRAQLIYLAPTLLRARVSAEDKAMYPPMKSKLEDTPVEVSVADHNDDDIETDTEETPQRKQNTFIPAKFEYVEDEDGGFIEAKFEIEEEEDRFIESKSEYIEEEDDEGEGY